jgi:hypothetical protein
MCRTLFISTSMTSSSLQTTALIAAEPTLYRTGLVSLLSQQWPSIALTLTADMGHGPSDRPSANTVLPPTYSG